MKNKENLRFLYFEGELVVNSKEEQDELCDKIEEFIKNKLKRKGKISIYRVIEQF